MFEGYRRRDFLLAIVSVFFFGASFPLLKYALFYLPPLTFATIRAILTALFFLTVSPLLGWRFKFPKGAPLRTALIVAFLSTTYPSVAQNYGIMLLEPSSAATLSSVFQSTSPIFTMFLAAKFLEEPITRKKAFGAAVSFTGIVLLSTGRGGVEALKSSATLGGLLILSTALSYAISGVLIKNTLKEYGAMNLLFWCNIFSALMFIPIGAVILFTGVENPTLTPLGMPIIWLSLLVLSMVVGGVIMIVWYRLIERYPISRLSYFSYLIPLFSGGIAISMMAEWVDIRTLLFSLLVIIGVYIVQSPEKARVKIPRDT
ncbi:MAG: DMT family transporter [Thermoplasmata archaeon]|nr:DMT family transporter [Thermoplasmata archaeon]